jgi:hypothetical protein
MSTLGFRGEQISSLSTQTSNRVKVQRSTLDADIPLVGASPSEHAELLVGSISFNPSSQVLKANHLSVGTVSAQEVTTDSIQSGTCVISNELTAGMILSTLLEVEDTLIANNCKITADITADSAVFTTLRCADVAITGQLTCPQFNAGSASLVSVIPSAEDAYCDLIVVKTSSPKAQLQHARGLSFNPREQKLTCSSATLTRLIATTLDAVVMTGSTLGVSVVTTQSLSASGQVQADSCVISNDIRVGSCTVEGGITAASISAGIISTDSLVNQVSVDGTLVKSGTKANPILGLKTSGNLGIEGVITAERFVANSCGLNGVLTANSCTLATSLTAASISAGVISTDSLVNQVSVDGTLVKSGTKANPVLGLNTSGNLAIEGVITAERFVGNSCGLNGVLSANSCTLATSLTATTVSATNITTESLVNEVSVDGTLVKSGTKANPVLGLNTSGNLAIGGTFTGDRFVGNSCGLNGVLTAHSCALASSLSAVSISAETVSTDSLVNEVLVDQSLIKLGTKARPILGLNTAVDVVFQGRVAAPGGFDGVCESAIRLNLGVDQQSVVSLPLLFSSVQLPNNAAIVRGSYDLTYRPIDKILIAHRISAELIQTSVLQAGRTTSESIHVLRVPSQTKGTWLGSSPEPVLWVGEYPASRIDDLPGRVIQASESPIGHGFLTTDSNTFRQVSKINNVLMAVTETSLDGVVTFGDPVGSPSITDLPRIIVGRSSSHDYGLKIGGWSDRTGPDSTNACIQLSSNLHIDCPNNGDLYLNYWNFRDTHLGGNIRPANDNLNSLGSGALVFANVFLQNQPSVRSDEALKQNIERMTAAEMRVAMQLAGGVCSYKFKSSMVRKNGAGRTHFGYIAQDIEMAFMAEGLNPGDYSLFIRNDAFTVDGAQKDSELRSYTAESPGVVVTSVYSLRYGELQCFIASALYQQHCELRKSFESLSQRLEQLESKS